MISYVATPLAFFRFMDTCMMLQAAQDTFSWHLNSPEGDAWRISTATR